MQEKNEEFTPKEKEMTFKEPRLNAEERLYLEAYLSTLDHSKAYRALKPNLKHSPSDNPYSRRENLQYHINKQLIEKTRAIALDKDDILSLLLSEAKNMKSAANARVQALNLLGKHLGLFEEVKEKDEIHFNIVNYTSGSDETKITKEVKVKEKIESLEEEELPSFLIKNYDEEER